MFSCLLISATLQYLGSTFIFVADLCSAVVWTQHAHEVISLIKVFYAPFCFSEICVEGGISVVLFLEDIFAFHIFCVL